MEAPKLIYLACPYSHPESTVRCSRAHAATKVAARLMDEGYHVFSPITYSFELHLFARKQHSYEYWLSFDFIMLDKADYLYVLKLDGWESSVGVKAEIERFCSQLDRKRKLTFIRPDEFGLEPCQTGCGESPLASL